MLDVSVMGNEASGGMGHTLGGLKIPYMLWGFGVGKKAILIKNPNHKLKGSISQSVFIRKSLFPVVAGNGVGGNILPMPQPALERGFHLPPPWHRLNGSREQGEKGRAAVQGDRQGCGLSYHPWSPWKASVHLEVSMKMQEEPWKSQRQGREPSRVQRSLVQSYTSISTR